MAKRLTAARAKRRRKKRAARKHLARPAPRVTDGRALAEAVFARRNPVQKALELLRCDRPTVEARVWERLLDYAFGRPAQAVEATGPHGGPVRVQIISHIPRPRREASQSAK